MESCCATLSLTVRRILLPTVERVTITQPDNRDDDRRRKNCVFVLEIRIVVRTFGQQRKTVVPRVTPPPEVGREKKTRRAKGEDMACGKGKEVYKRTSHEEGRRSDSRNVLEKEEDGECQIPIYLCAGQSRMQMETCLNTPFDSN